MPPSPHPPHPRFIIFYFFYRYHLSTTRHTLSHFSKHGHMGFSVASGRFFHGHVYFASGAPHAGPEDSRTGEIHFFHKSKSGSSRSQELQFEEHLTLRGEAFGSGFGYTLATMDVNGDTVPDLLVGAPFFDGGKSGRGGAAYLYVSQRGALQR